MAKRICTLGYEGLSIEKFVAVLKAGGVRQVIDVRETPLSRKPGFSKKSLHGHLAAAGIDYKHFVEMGCPKPVRDQFRLDQDWKVYTRGFLRHLSKQGDVLEELGVEAETKRSCLICYEADFNECHRSFVADEVARRRGLEVDHLSIKSIGAGSRRAA